MKKVIYFLLFLVMGIFITITLSNVRVFAEPNEEETPQEEVEEPVENTEEEIPNESEETNEGETNTDTNEDEVAESEDDKYAEIRESISAILDSIDELKAGNVNLFEDKLINHLITTALGVVGTLAVVFIYLKKNKVIASDITSLITNGKKTDEALVEDFKAQIEFVKKQAIELGVKEEQINKLEESTKKLIGNFDEKVAVLEEQLNNQKIQNNEILEILKIAFLNNSDLVKNGYAAKIERLIEKYEQK